MEVQFWKLLLLPPLEYPRQTEGPSTPDDFSAKHRPAEQLEFSTKEFPNGLSSITTESLRLLQAGSSGEEKY